MQERDGAGVITGSGSQVWILWTYTIVSLERAAASLISFLFVPRLIGSMGAPIPVPSMPAQTNESCKACLTPDADWHSTK